jgi:hypothetical protein
VNLIFLPVESLRGREYTPQSTVLEAFRAAGSDSVLFRREQTGARLKNGRPLQKQHPSKQIGFVEASPSRALRDGEGTSVYELSDYRPAHPICARMNDGERIRQAENIRRILMLS